MVGLLEYQYKFKRWRRKRVAKIFSLRWPIVIHVSQLILTSEYILERSPHFCVLDQFKTPNLLVKIYWISKCIFCIYMGIICRFLVKGIIRLWHEVNVFTGSCSLIEKYIINGLFNELKIVKTWGLYLGVRVGGGLVYKHLWMNVVLF